jgi:hypothetical protein
MKQLRHKIIPTINKRLFYASQAIPISIRGTVGEFSNKVDPIVWEVGFIIYRSVHSSL